MKVGGSDGGSSDDHAPGGAARQWRDERWRETLARQWAAGISGTSYIPMSRPAIERCLLELVDHIAAALEDPADIDEAGRAVGSRLVRMHATGDESLARSLEILRESLVTGSGSEPARRTLALLAAVAAGYASADRESTFEQQEALKRALLRSKLHTERELQVSEARFREMFTTAQIGVAICDLDGKFIETNATLEDTLGYSEQDLQARTIHDLFDPEEARGIAVSYAELAEGRRQGLRERRNLVRADGERAWTYLAVSVLRDADGAPRHFVTMVEDLRELSSLQDRLQHQALHDAMTGLANRQYFRTRLETALATLPKDATLTLYHLGLDGFELINDGLGYETGDIIVRAVAKRLERLVEDEDGLVARFGGTEFAILLRQSPDTPGIASFAALVNEELSEPVYVGEYGIATSASIGVIQRTAGGMSPADMMWGADVALRRAEAAGKRQWALFDPDRAPEERIEARLAAIMPGALELGEFDVVYQPLVSMSDGRLTGVEAQLSWQPQGHDRLDHTECLRLAERSGVTLSLRDWMLREAWAQVDAWHREGYRPRLITGLSPNQSRDPDLVARVREVLGSSDLDPSWLRLCMPVTAVMAETAEARDNVHVLDSAGVQTALHDFRASPAELRHLRDLPAHAVQFAGDLVQLMHERDSEDSPEVRAIAGAIPLIRDCGVPIAVLGLETEEQAAWWHSMGCEIGAGPAYGGPVPAEEVTRLLAGG